MRRYGNSSRMLIRFVSLVLLSVVAVSCTPVGNVDYSGLRSVGFANGMGNKLNRVRIGTTVFSNSSEVVDMPGLSPKVTSAAIGILNEKVDRVEKLDVPTSPAKFSLLAQRSPDINAEEFRGKSIEVARAKGLDAVWILFPFQLSGSYGARGIGTKGYEHRQDSFLGRDNDAVHCSAIAELIDVRSGKTLRTNGTSLFGFKQIDSEEWQEEWSDVSASRKKTITDGIIEASELALRQIL